jgi:UDP-glucose 4-epimerase
VVKSIFAGKTVLVTGGTGSFGNVVTRHILNTDVDQVRIFSRDEKKQEDMRLEIANPKAKFFIGDVRNYNSILEAMRGVDYVFSAAALKQVPSCEFHPLEAVQTNVLGSENVLNAAIACGVRNVVMLSTDKAVYPINAMGITKALMEKLMVAKSRFVDSRLITLCGTRYGNVMGSRGSVIPLFIKQIKENRPITITDPSMTRFLMSLEDAMNLVLYAFKNAKGGDIFVQKSPAATVQDVATALKEIFHSDVPIKIIGTRHGEKKHETLLNREERQRAEDLGEYYRIAADDRDLNYNSFTSEGESKISDAEDYTSENTERLDVVATKKLLLKLELVRNELNR